MKTTKSGSVVLAEFKEENILELLFNGPHLIYIKNRVIPVMQNYLCWNELSIIVGTLKKCMLL